MFKRFLFVVLFLLWGTSVYAQDVTGSGSISAGQSVALAIDGHSTAVITVQSTVFTGSLEFEGTGAVDYAPLNCVQMTGFILIGSNVVNSASAPGIFHCSIGGFSTIRVRKNGGTGTAGIIINASAADSVVNTITQGTTLIGTVSPIDVNLPADAATETTLAALDAKIPSPIDSRVPITSGINVLDALSVGADPLFPIAGLNPTTAWAPIEATDTTPNADDVALVTRNIPSGTQNTLTPRATATGTLGALNETVEINLDGQRSAGFALWPSSFVGTLMFEHISGNGDWEPTYALDLTGGGWAPIVTNPSIQSAEYAAYIGGYERGYRVRVHAYTSGSVLVEMTASTMESHWRITSGADGSTTVGGNVVGGIDGSSLFRMLQLRDAAPAGTEYGLITRNIPSGTQTVAGDSTDGSVAGAAPGLIVSGVDFFGNSQRIVTNVFGQLLTASEYNNNTAGATSSQVTLVGGAGPTGESRMLAMDASGRPNINVISSVLPTGASTEANQTTTNASLSSIDGKFPTAAALTDNTANPTLSKLQTFTMVWDQIGGNWDRWTGNVGVTGSVGITGTATVDTEFGVSAALADNMANPSSPPVSSFQMVWDGSTWDRWNGSVTANAGSGIFTVSTPPYAGFNQTAYGTAGETHVAVVAGIEVGGGNRALRTDLNGELQVDVLTLPATPAGNNNIGDVDVASFPDNEPFNVAQIAGTAAAVNNGTANAGTQRQTVASDNSAIANWGHGAVGSAVPSGATAMAGTDGTNLTRFYVDPCQRGAKTHRPFSASAAGNIQIADATGTGNKVYICSIVLVTNAANNVALIEDDTALCVSPTAGMAGGTTAATGWNFGANGGLTFGDGSSSVFATAATNRFVCLAMSASTQLSGNIAYVIAP